LLPIFDPTKKIKKRKKIKKEILKKLEDIHEESLENCPNWW
jgi:hypothetical protein